MPKIVVLTGGIGSGKSTVSSIFKSFNIEIVDTDIISSRLTDKDGDALKILKENFAPVFFNTDGTLNKGKFRLEIFSKIKEKLKLEKILHPMIAHLAKQEIELAKSPYVIQVVPLWVEKNKDSKTNIFKLIVVDCCEAIQRQRAMSRSKIDAITFNQIKANQVPRPARNAVADYIINNNGEIGTLKPQVLKIHNHLLNDV